jgi:hypothetical protein
MLPSNSRASMQIAIRSMISSILCKKLFVFSPRPAYIQRQIARRQVAVQQAAAAAAFIHQRYLIGFLVPVISQAR